MVIRPFLDSMTASELHAVMTNGFSTVAGSAVAAYILYGVSDLDNDVCHTTTKELCSVVKLKHEANGRSSLTTISENY